jgi:hypothetical protein
VIAGEISPLGGGAAKMFCRVILWQRMLPQKAYSAGLKPTINWRNPNDAPAKMAMKVTGALNASMENALMP